MTMTHPEQNVSSILKTRSSSKPELNRARSISSWNEIKGLGRKIEFTRIRQKINSGFLFIGLRPGPYSINVFSASTQATLKFNPSARLKSGHMTFLSYSDWSNFSVASIEAEKTLIGLGPGSAKKTYLEPDRISTFRT